MIKESLHLNCMCLTNIAESVFDLNDLVDSAQDFRAPVTDDYKAANVNWST